MKRLWFTGFALAATTWAQEANSGFDLKTTLTAAADYSHELSENPRDDGPLSAGFRAMFYPTWKLNSHWTFSGAVQVHSRPFFPDEFNTQGYGVKADILQANIGYSQYWGNRSLVVRAGMLSSAFGSFLLRYDDDVNPLIDMPLTYGYYGQGVTTLGLAGVQADATVGRLDFRAQFVNSSPENRRSIFDHDQYGDWAGGIGYTILQGFRVGVSAYRGPYLDRQYAFYFPGEAPPHDLPATAYGADVAWGHGPWNVYGEWQHFQMIYRAIPDFNEHAGYAEVRRVLAPRWYVATRSGYLNTDPYPGKQAYEMVAGFRPNIHQTVKLGYEIQRGPAIRGTLDNIVEIELVTTLHPLTLAKN
jgi:hypothetical protein